MSDGQYWGDETIIIFNTRTRAEHEPTRVWYDYERTEPVFEVVATAMDKHARGNAGLPPLTDYVDADTLDTLFSRDTSGAPRVSGVSLESDYAGLVVTVESVGRIEIRDAGR